MPPIEDMATMAFDKEEDEERGVSHDAGEKNVPVPQGTGPIVSVPPIADVPDGGWKAWVQVGGSFTLFFNTW